MYGPRLYNEYIKGVDEFNYFMKKNMLDNIRGNIYCPCKHCKNEKRSHRWCVEVTFDQAWIHGGLSMLK
jgi:hypothetical protein